MDEIESFTNVLRDLVWVNAFMGLVTMGVLFLMWGKVSRVENYCTWLASKEYYKETKKPKY